ncbi:DEAD/DEAH box helicase family protein [Phascolarctobacterium sp.]|uniref:DEAD/DEAH box helicase family protein n=1 Tax=Phascolarctobacterium sp. TaxID=2049039 RepID=UPI002A83A41E|nr:DEAD/DEAH box helicase family protein [Phascolarctobacterium sp.]MDY5045251.1 DEAD/DEAH box helicase family protein [Phascolarctobacterium sp.]
MALKFNPYKNINPQIYAYTTPHVTTNDGWIKIGYTEKQTVEARVRQQCHTANIAFDIKWHEVAKYTAGIKAGSYFTDHDFHEYLTRFCQIPRNQGTEWFKTDAEISHKLFHKFAAQNYDGVQVQDKGTQYTLRKEQQEAVDKTVEYFYNNKSLADCDFLWNAKPRFGKTLTTYDFMRRIDAKNVLIVTNRPSIANSWYDDFSKFISWQTPYIFVSETDALSEKPVLSRQHYLDKVWEMDEREEARMVAFESLQGLKGSIYFGGEYDKLKWIQEIDWDLLVIDEAHEGVDTYKTDIAFRDIRRKFTLHLSGTPFKAIAMGKFGNKQIFNWTFADEQEAKEKWYKDCEEYNPYASMPRMNLYTYQMSKIIQDQVNQGLDLAEGENAEYAFDLNEFFSTKADGKFVYEKDVKKFLDALVTYDKFPFSTKELREQMAHTFWLLERVDSAKAMAKLLKNHPVFENYEVIIAAGDGRLEDEDADAQQSKRSLDKVREAIKNHPKTITLSVGQLTTGVTIPEWTAVFMLSNMRSSAEYIQAAFRAQNPYKFEKDGKYYQKEDAYIFDFAPERTLMVYDEFANSLYSSTAAGGGTKEQREKNIKRLINFFSVFAEDEEGKMVELDAAKVLTIPIKIKTDEVIKRGFMSNFLFANISNVFGAPDVVRNILNQIKPEEEQGRKKDAPSMDDMEDIPVNGQGEIEIPQEVIVNQTNAIFGEKVFDTTQEEVAKVFAQSASEQKQAEETGQENVIAPHYAVVEKFTKEVHETLEHDTYGKAKEKYNLTNKQVEKIVNKQEADIRRELTTVADEYDGKQRQMELDKNKKLEQAATVEQKTAIEAEYEEKKEQAQQEFITKVETKVQEVAQQVAANTVQEMETKKEENKKRAVEGDIRAHLRGFARTIPSFIMAYGDDALKLDNFETYPPDGVFKDVTSITVDQFRFLRDGGDYIDEETGETKHFEGHLFDEVVFDESIKAFLEKKRALANYFDETHTEDIFDYIPPQETNQIFTPKKVVKMMVDQLEENEPHIFDYPDKTFVDFYMKSGLYITEIVKRLYRNPLMKSLYPDDMERIKHILECQVFGFAPTQIIFDIAMSYIFGFDEGANQISRRNFFAEDTLPWAEKGELQKLVNEKLGDRIE